VRPFRTRTLCGMCERFMPSSSRCVESFACPTLWMYSLAKGAGLRVQFIYMYIYIYIYIYIHTHTYICTYKSFILILLSLSRALSLSFIHTHTHFLSLSRKDTLARCMPSSSRCVESFACPTLWMNSLEVEGSDFDSGDSGFRV